MIVKYDSKENIFYRKILNIFLVALEQYEHVLVQGGSGFNSSEEENVWETSFKVFK